MKKNGKKKGFTLIELIAVIAILGILAAVLVPNIIGYTNKARKAKVVADAKIIVNAVSAYNSDADTATPILDTVVVSTTIVTADYPTIVGTTGTVTAIPASLGVLTVGQCRGITEGTIKYGTAKGEYTVSSSGVASIVD